MDETSTFFSNPDELFQRFLRWQREHPELDSERSFKRFCEFENLPPAAYEELAWQIANAHGSSHVQSNPPADPESPLDEPLTESYAPQPTATHRRIGRYKLLQEVGAGGMGTVWLAEQSEPVQRRVALKLIKSSVVSRDEIARFEAERQALAMMDHPSIAKVFDGGTTEHGEPYFVMEFVPGMPINEFCDKHRLSVSDRLQLFIPVCRAVQHAHQKGIVHRDLKPSNILVMESEGFPVPKVIDFGLAKATDHTRKLTEKTLFTEVGKVVGTLQYMSPEQAALNSNDIDTRSDIYSLGIILYELLTGSPPLDRDTIRRNAILKILEMIRQQETPRPSHRLSSSGERISDIGQLRRIDPKRLHSILYGELDWVVMKALEKDRKRRYETAASFADDLHRFLINEPVVAKPPSRAYWLSKLIRRNRVAFVIATLVILLATFGFAGTLIAWRQTVRSAQLSAEKEQQATEFAVELAGTQRAANQAIMHLYDSLRSGLEGFWYGSEVEFSSSPVAEENLLIESRRKLAALYSMLGFHFRTQKADPKEWGSWFARAINEYESLQRDNLLSPAGILSYANALDNLAYFKALEHDREEALRLSKLTLQQTQHLRDFATPEQRDRLSVKEAAFCLNAGNYGDGYNMLSHGIDQLITLKNRDHEEELLLGKLFHNRASEVAADNSTAHGELDCLRAIEIFEKLENFELLASAYNIMMNVLEQKNSLEKREIYAEKARVLREKRQQDNPDWQPSTTDVYTIFNQAMHHHQLNDLETALQSYNELDRILKQAIASSPGLRRDRVYFQTYWHRAEILRENKQYPEAIPDAAEALSAVIGSHDPEFATYIPYLSASLAELRATIDPLAVAHELDPTIGDYEAKSLTQLKLAAVYSLAAGKQNDAAERQLWIDKAFELLTTIAADGMLDAEIKQELREHEHFVHLRDDPRWPRILAGEKLPE
jgi:serine/threonine protein kinase